MCIRDRIRLALWAGRLELLPKVRAWSIGPPHPTLLPVTALWPNTVFGTLAQLEGGKRGLLTQHFCWSNSPTGHQIEEALFFRVSFLPPYQETRLPNGLNWRPVQVEMQMQMKAKMKAKSWMNWKPVQMKMKASPNVIHAVLYHEAWLPWIILLLTVSANEIHAVLLYHNVCIIAKVH